MRQFDKSGANLVKFTTVLLFKLRLSRKRQQRRDSSYRLFDQASTTLLILTMLIVEKKRNILSIVYGQKIYCYLAYPPDMHYLSP